jgi:acyl carrier protein
MPATQGNEPSAEKDAIAFERRIAEILIQRLKLEDVTAETFDVTMNLVEELGIDSMDMATVVLVLQDEYKVKIDEDHYPRLTSVRAIATYIRNLRAAA